MDGTFDRMLAGAQSDADAAGDINWLVSVDSSIVRVHQHAAGGGKGGGQNPANQTPMRARNQLTAVMDSIHVARRGRGRPRTRPDHVIADKGYSTSAIRGFLRSLGIGHTIPERADQQANRRRRGSRGGRPPTFDRHRYRHRNVVERCFNRLKQCRSVATRYDKTTTSYRATVTIAAILRWL
ncbi:transposase [Dactylosporangium vinaceum]|nr:transposase [Dactylosporangium vinaceum]UAB96072.1 transposase [Dactylosporangium vinaceum]